MKEHAHMTPMYAMSPSGPELSQRALRRRLRERGVQIVTLPAGHYILAAHRAAADAVVAEINAHLRHLSDGRTPRVDEQLRVRYRPIPTPTDGEAA